MVAFHFCSGEYWDECLCAQVLEEAATLGRSVISVALDPCNAQGADLLDAECWAAILHLFETDRMLSVGGGPPCSTWSRLRHRPLPGGGGPRPLRSRADPFICLPGRNKREIAAFNTGTLIMTRCLYIFGLALMVGAHVWMEHPEDPKGIYPSVWATQIVGRLRELGMKFACFDQCRFGGTARKPTTVMTICSQLHSELNDCRCTGGHSHARTTGVSETVFFHYFPCQVPSTALQLHRALSGGLDTTISRRLRGWPCGLEAGVGSRWSSS